MPAILTWLISLGVIKAAALIAAWLGVALLTYTGLSEAVEALWAQVQRLISAHHLSEFVLFSLRLARIDDVIAVLQALIVAKLTLFPVKTLVLGALAKP